ncbi:MmyB family transcriptional regulator [Saccharothrix sp. NRRL B-16314]|uniref:MmyB family transcriptional regulator n=1 Tax=Saccharothrix sp. NRRL B-16314 TaxID=1463825 RepID=UPI001E532D5A|nr:hypothetical protein [Saccharothrix sp. NRRL B-16314]
MWVWSTTATGGGWPPTKAGAVVGASRLASGRHPDDPALASFVGELSARSREFASRWADTASRRSAKRWSRCNTRWSARSLALARGHDPARARPRSTEDSGARNAVAGAGRTIVRA